jgi:hypothetical protein
MKPEFDITQPDRLPDGTTFRFWDDATPYTRVYHVAQQHPAADDAHDGSAARPWRTIQRAAAALQPGEKVVVHAGIYRECVAPQRGGTGPDRMIAYEAAPGEPVVIRASEPWQPAAVDKSQWTLFRGAPAEQRIWLAELPREKFVGYNPFITPNILRSGFFPWQKRPLAELERAQLTRGMLFQEGRPLRQVARPQELFESPGRFWVRGDGVTLAVRLWDDAPPESVALELSVRTQCFAPAPGVNWLRVTGFVMEHAANGVPLPQFGALSAGGGHHWIIADNTVRHANALGLDIGWQADVRPVTAEPAAGGHIVRRNVVTDCGVAGVCGTRGVNGSLIEGNRFERIGGLDLEHCYEAAAIKFHFLEGALIRDNVIQDCRAACGIWLDYLCHGNRVTRNHIGHIETVLAGIYLEANINGPPNVVDQNVVTDIRDHPPNDPPKDGIAGGMGISVDICEDVWVLNNVVERCEHYAIACHLAQPDRLVQGRKPRGTGMRVFDNQIRDCGKHILLRPSESNASADNIFDGPLLVIAGRT